MATIKTLAKRTGSFINQYSPQILIGTGILAGIGATVTACIATKKAQPIVERFRQELVDIHEDANAGKLDKKDARRELARVYRTALLELSKYYGIPVGLSVVSIGCTLCGTGIMQSRYAGVTAALGAATASLSQTYKRLAADLGEDKAQNYLYGLKDETVKETETDPETGEVKKVKKTIKVPIDETINDFSVEFDGGPNYDNNVEYNRMFVNATIDLAKRNHEIDKVPMFLDEFFGKHYLDLPVKSERLQKMRHHVGWAADTPVMVDTKIVVDVDEEGNRRPKLMLYFMELSGNPWAKENK